ncbi:MAG: FtsK/SpoIIIE domain-containing protein, partial [Rhodoglobus sp.]
MRAPCEIAITVGRGTEPSTLTLEPSAGSDVSSFGDDIRALAADARELSRSPITVDARLGLGVCGPPQLAQAVARSLAVQLAWRLSPADHWWAGDGDEQTWLAALPHQRRPGTTKGALYEFGRRDDQGSPVVVAVARAPEGLPGSCRIVIDLGSAGARVVRHPDPERRGPVTTDVVSREQCRSWARRMHADATTEGVVAPHSAIPSAVELGPLLRVVDDGGRVSLACEPAVSAAGPLCLDLVADGPHAVVGGTTGSGKSELLIAWVLAMAAPRSPADVTFLLVDFKGGSAFAALARLPHT